MDKEDILIQARKENNGSDVVDVEVQKKAAYISYMIGILGIILVDIINLIILKNVNHGPNFIIALMCMIVFLIKYINLRKKHELFVMIMYNLLTIVFLVLWILQLCGVM